MAKKKLELGPRLENVKANAWLASVTNAKNARGGVPAGYDGMGLAWYSVTVRVRRCD